jgi:hypothetical protein
MALMPGIIHDLVPTTKNMVAVDGVVVHTIVGLWSGGKAAHATNDYLGTLRQHRDTDRQSAANLDGNPRWLAIENEDRGTAYGNWNVNDGHAVPGFTDAQCEGNARWLAWVHHQHGVPLELVPDTKPGRRGIAYHRQGIDGNYAGYAYGGRVSGGVRFSSATGKVCPGDRRIYQLINIIIPRARVLAGLEEDDMNVWDLVNFRPVRGQNLWDQGEQIQRNQSADEARDKALAQAVGALTQNKDITPEEFARVVNSSIAEHMPSAQAVADLLKPDLISEVLPHIRAVISEVFGEDNEELALQFVQALGRAAAAAIPAPRPMADQSQGGN